MGNYQIYDFIQVRNWSSFAESNHYTIATKENIAGIKNILRNFRIKQ